jgi:hypothetical protein
MCLISSRQKNRLSWLITTSKNGFIERWNILKHIRIPLAPLCRQGNWRRRSNERWIW